MRVEAAAVILSRPNSMRSLATRRELVVPRPADTGADAATAPEEVAAATDQGAEEDEEEELG